MARSMAFTAPAALPPFCRAMGAWSHMMSFDTKPRRSRCSLVTKYICSLKAAPTKIGSQSVTWLHNTIKGPFGA